MTVIESEKQMAKKNASVNPNPKQYGTLIRVGNEFADALRKACALEGVSVAEFAEANFLPIIQKRYRESLAKEAKRMEGQGE
jgi:hypothetical protein